MALDARSEVWTDKPPKEISGWAAYGGYPQTKEVTLRASVIWSYDLVQKLKSIFEGSGLDYQLAQDSETKRWSLVLVVSNSVQRLLIQSGSETGEAAKTLLDYAAPPTELEVQNAQKKAERILQAAGL